MIMNVLPEKLSDCIEVAVRDLELVERDPNYRINMGYWHDNRFEVCFVCFAGAVIAKTLNCSINDFLAPHDFDPYTRNRLQALNSVRVGFITGAVSHILDGTETIYAGFPSGINLDPKIKKEVGKIEDAYFYDYNKDPEDFKRSVLEIAKKLRALDL